MKANLGNVKNGSLSQGGRERKEEKGKEKNKSCLKKSTKLARYGGFLCSRSTWKAEAAESGIQQSHLWLLGKFEDSLEL